MFNLLCSHRSAAQRLPSSAPTQDGVLSTFMAFSSALKCKCKCKCPATFSLHPSPFLPNVTGNDLNGACKSSSGLCVLVAITVPTVSMGHSSLDGPDSSGTLRDTGKSHGQTQVLVHLSCGVCPKTRNLRV